MGETKERKVELELLLEIDVQKKKNHHFLQMSLLSVLIQKECPCYGEKV